MSNDKFRQPEMEINLKEIIWDLLEQWKAILLVALATALIVSAAKYYKDLSIFKKAQEVLETPVEETYPSLDEHINAILSELSEDDREMIQLVMQQEAWLDNQRDYFNNSLVLSTDPNAQRQLYLSYYVYGVENNAYSAISRSYVNHLKEDDFLNAVKKHINATIDYKYIKELISGSYTSTDGNESPGEILSVNVVLPESADAVAIEAEITKLLGDYSKELSEKIAAHSIKFIESNDITVVNENASSRRTSIINSINSLNTSISNNKRAMSAEQKDAYAQIQAAKDRYEGKIEEEEDIVVNEPKKPSISFKYAIMGLILGTVVYFFIYIVWLILKGRVNYASDIENYTGIRLLGSVYCHDGANNKCNSLLKSSKVEALRYRDRIDENKQIMQAVTSMGASCEHSGAKSVTIFDMTASKVPFKQSIDTIVVALKSKGYGVDVKEVEGIIDEMDLLDLENAVIAVSRLTKVKELGNLVGLLKDYDINTIGSVFIGVV